MIAEGILERDIGKKERPTKEYHKEAWAGRKDRGQGGRRRRDRFSPDDRTPCAVAELFRLPSSITRRVRPAKMYEYFITSRRAASPPAPRARRLKRSVWHS